MNYIKNFVPPNEGELILINKKFISKWKKRGYWVTGLIMTCSILITYNLNPTFFSSNNKIDSDVILIISFCIVSFIISVILLIILGVILFVILIVVYKWFFSLFPKDEIGNVFYFNSFLSGTGTSIMGKINGKLPYSEFHYFQYDGKKVIVNCYDNLFLSDYEEQSVSGLHKKYSKGNTVDEFFDIINTKNMYHNIEFEIVKKYSKVGGELIGFLNNKISESKNDKISESEIIDLFKGAVYTEGEHF